MTMQVIKVGGELLETGADVEAVVGHIALAATLAPLVVVHGGGRELSAELRRRGGTTRMIDGIRVTDDAGLAAAVGVLAGTVNTRVVAALGAAGVRAVGLSGVDGALLLARRSPRVRSRTGALADLGHVGVPLPAGDVSLLTSLCRERWVPVVASIGVTSAGELLNVNADVAAAHLAVALRAVRLTVLGATDGVLDASGRAIELLTRKDGEALIASGAARDGMAAKLDACMRARAGGVADVRIVNGRHADLETGGTRIEIGGTGGLSGAAVNVSDGAPLAAPLSGSSS